MCICDERSSGRLELWIGAAIMRRGQVCVSVPGWAMHAFASLSVHRHTLLVAAPLGVHSHCVSHRSFPWVWDWQYLQYIIS